MVRYEEVQARGVLNPVRGMGFRWSLNPYRGCTHGCHYCFARRYHSYLDLNPDRSFESVIFVKVNAPAVLREELARPSWRRELVAIGTATDPYQPVEGRYRLTRGILEILAEFRTPASLVTKGTMVVRDRDVLAELGRRASATVSISLTTLDRDLWRRLEPGTPPPEQRLRAMGELARVGIRAGVLLAPIVPGLTATPRHLAPLLRAAADHGARFVVPNLLYLKPGVKEHFEAFLAAEAPDLLPLYRRLYPGAYAPRAYGGGRAGAARTLADEGAALNADSPREASAPRYTRSAARPPVACRAGPLRVSRLSAGAPLKPG
ncbi:MAG: radical SAM protein [Candidatus Rokubacteria bacterium]|nr:radical SAM protein [Candidatus Rokubacteria bacterium]